MKILIFIYIAIFIFINKYIIAKIKKDLLTLIDYSSVKTNIKDVNKNINNIENDMSSKISVNTDDKRKIKLIINNLFGLNTNNTKSIKSLKSLLLDFYSKASE